MPTVRGTWVRDLRCPGSLAAEPVCLPDTIAQAVRQVGRPAVDWAVYVGLEIATRAIAETPEFGHDADAVALLRLGTESAAIRTLLAIDAGEPQELGATAESVEMMHEYVHRRTPLEKIWASVRHGHAWFADYYMAACRQLVPASEQPEQLELISRTLFDWVHAFTTGIGELFHDEEERWVSSAAAARTETLNAVLDGDDVDPSAASAVLRYELAHQTHLALVLCQEGPAVADATALHRVAADALTELGATNTLIVPVGRTELWAWGSSPLPFEDFAEALSGLDMRGARAVAGTPCKGVEGFRRTHEQAQRAARVVLLTGHHTMTVVSYQVVSLLAALTADPDQARAFVADELGALAGGDESTATLRKTLLAYLEAGRSPQTAAGRLFVAKNTVVYRVKRAEELLGRSADIRQLELWNALRLAQAFTDPIALLDELRAADSRNSHHNTIGADTAKSSERAPRIGPVDGPRASSNVNPLTRAPRPARTT